MENKIHTFTQEVLSQPAGTNVTVEFVGTDGKHYSIPGTFTGESKETPRGMVYEITFRGAAHAWFFANEIYKKVGA